MDRLVMFLLAASAAVVALVFLAPTSEAAGCATFANDCFADAVLFTTSGMKVNSSGFSPTPELNEPACASNQSAWIEIAPAFTMGNVSVTVTGTPTWTQTPVAAFYHGGLFTGASLAALTPSSPCLLSDTQGKMVFTISCIAGQKQYIQLGGIRTGYDGMVATLTPNPCTPACPGPSNDCFAAATWLTPGNVTGTNVNASMEGGEPNACGQTTNITRSVWYRFNSAGNSDWGAFDTAGSDFHNSLGIYTGMNPTVLSIVNCSGGTWSDGSGTSAFTFQCVPNTIYSIQVGGRSGAMGNISLRMTPCGSLTFPDPPQLDPVDAGNGYMRLTWSAPANDGGSPVQVYYLYRSINGSAYSGIANLPSNVHSYNETVSPGSTYAYRLTAVTNAGEGNASNVATGVALGAPSAPTNPVAAAGNHTVALSWTAPTVNGGTAITGYRVYRGFSTNGEGLLAAIGTNTSFTDATVTNGVTYYYDITAITAVAESAPSIEVSATPSARPLAPLAVSTTPGNQYVLVQWSPPSSDGG